MKAVFGRSLAPEIGIVFLAGPCSNKSVAKAKQDKKRERRTRQEIVVDAHNTEEQAMGLHY